MAPAKTRAAYSPMLNPAAATQLSTTYRNEIQISEDSKEDKNVTRNSGLQTVCFIGIWDLVSFLKKSIQPFTYDLSTPRLSTRPKQYKMTKPKYQHSKSAKHSSILSAPGKMVLNSPTVTVGEGASSTEGPLSKMTCSLPNWFVFLLPSGQDSSFQTQCLSSHMRSARPPACQAFLFVRRDALLDIFQIRPLRFCLASN